MNCTINYVVRKTVTVLYSDDCEQEAICSVNTGLDKRRFLKNESFLFSFIKVAR